VTRHPFDLTHDPLAAIVLTFVAVCAAVVMIVYPEKMQMWWWTYLNNFGAIERVRRPSQVGSRLTTMLFRCTGVLIAAVLVLVLVLFVRTK
jgi:hypothetical protein